MSYLETCYGLLENSCQESYGYQRLLEGIMSLKGPQFVGKVSKISKIWTQNETVGLGLFFIKMNVDARFPTSI